MFRKKIIAIVCLGMVLLLPSCQDDLSSEVSVSEATDVSYTGGYGDGYADGDADGYADGAD